MGIRLDGGTAYSGAIITRFYDSLLEKVTAWAPTPKDAISRMDRALREFRIRGVSTNISFVENLLKHKKFKENGYSTKFIDETPELFQFSEASKTRSEAFLDNIDVFGSLGQNALFSELFCYWLRYIHRLGVRAAIRKYVAKEK